MLCGHRPVTWPLNTTPVVDKIKAQVLKGQTFSFHSQEELVAGGLELYVYIDEGEGVTSWAQSATTKSKSDIQQTGAKKITTIIVSRGPIDRMKSRMNGFTAVFLTFIQCDAWQSFFSTVSSRSSVYSAVAAPSNSFHISVSDARLKKTPIYRHESIQTLT